MSESESESESIDYLDDGRLINGRTDHLKIPSTHEILKNVFFERLKECPVDYKESESVVFKYRMK